MGCFVFCFILRFFWLGSHEHPKDNQALQLFVFNIVLVGRKSGGKRKLFLPSSWKKCNCHLVSSFFLGWWSKITPVNDLSNLSCQLEYFQRIWGGRFRTAIWTFIFVLILL